MSKEDPKPTNQWQNPNQQNLPNEEDITELTEEDLEQVNGGDRADVTVNKAKPADKAFGAMDAYIRQ